MKNSPEVVQNLLVSGLEAHTDQKLKKISEGLGEIVAILGAQEVPPQLFMSSFLNLPKSAAKDKK